MILRFSNFVRNIQNYFFAIIYLLKRSNFLYVFFLFQSVSMFQLNSSLVIRFNFFFPFFTNYQREENAKDQRDVDKNVFFFRRRYFNANSQEKRITLDCTFSFSFFLLSRPFSPSFFWIHRITRVFVFDQRFAKRKKKKRKKVRVGR